MTKRILWMVLGLCFLLWQGDVWSKPKSKPKTRSSAKKRGRNVARTTGEDARLAQIIRRGRFRSNVCWKLYREVMDSIERQRVLLQKFTRIPCDEKQWKQCKREQFRPASCRSKAQKVRWGGCFRIHRRLFVIAHRLSKWGQESIKNRCQWRVRIPNSFAEIAFAPFPRLDSSREDG